MTTGNRSLLKYKEEKKYSKAKHCAVYRCNRNTELVINHKNLSPLFFIFISVLAHSLHVQLMKGSKFDVKHAVPFLLFLAVTRKKEV